MLSFFIAISSMKSTGPWPMFVSLMLLLIILLVVKPLKITSHWLAGADTSTDPFPYRRNGENENIPASFDCEMRKAAYEFGIKVIERRKGAFPELYYALDLNSKDCHQEMLSPSSPSSSVSPQRRSRFLQDDAGNAKGSQSTPKEGVTIFVSKDIGDDFHPQAGTQKHPFRSIQAAADHAAASTALPSSYPTVVLRDGTYYLTEPILLNANHTGVKFIAYPGEHVVISGGILLKIKHWKPFMISDKANIWVTNISDQVIDEVPGLQMNGKRCTRARYPNIPGGIEVSCGYGCMISGEDVAWTPPDFNKYGNATYYTDNITAHNRPNAGWFEHYMVGREGLCSVYDPPVSYWCSEHASGGGAFSFRTPSGVRVTSETTLPNARSYGSVEDALFFVWRPKRWANWMFEVADYDPIQNNFTFGAGGNQGARGENFGGDFFVENVFEELDAPGEFFFNRSTGLLYLFHNGTGSPAANATFVVPQLRTLVNVSGTQWNPAKDIAFRDISFQSSRYTYMDPHGVPSAGDWALDRVAAVFLQGTENVTIENCVFDRLDGNGAMLSGYNRHATISNSDFSYLGGNAIVAWGYTNETETDPGRPGVTLQNWPAAGVDGTDGEHPRYTIVTKCTAREIGLYEKQSSFYMQAKTAESTISSNVFFNGPRAGINFNDGFGGGDEVAHNLVFSTCRESGDHGPLNSWDRQPYLTTVRDGNPSMVMQWREIHHNFFIDNYSPQEGVDNDDGSAYYLTHSNFLVYGRQGMKNDYGGHDNRHWNNIYAYVERGLYICGQLDGNEDYFYNNTVVMTGDYVGWFACNGTGRPVLHDNLYFTPTGTIFECHMPLANWQDLGQDRNSKVSKLPTDQNIIQWAKELLDF